MTYLAKKGIHLKGKKNFFQRVDLSNSRILGDLLLSCNDCRVLAISPFKLRQEANNKRTLEQSGSDFDNPFPDPIINFSTSLIYHLSVCMCVCKCFYGRMRVNMFPM